MASMLFQPYTIKDVTLKNRIVMSPMCMYSCTNRDGKATNWHFTHYTTRAVGQVGLIIIEATAVAPEGRISTEDLGIWSNDHIEDLSKLTDMIHEHGAKVGIQLAHAGRKAQLDETIFAPSAIPFSDRMKVPEEMTTEKISETIQSFQKAAKRARLAGFDVIEIHAAHGYLINEFLSPVTNKRTDEFGGSKMKRYRFLSDVIEAVKSEWSGPLFVRISANDYDSNGYRCGDYVEYANMMKEQGVDLIDCSSGGVVPVPFDAYPGYQVPYAEQIRREAGIATAAVGLITNAEQAEEIIRNRRADLIFLGRALLRNPYWPYAAAKQLGVSIEAPKQYERGWV